jgi:hypothetical protein
MALRPVLMLTLMNGPNRLSCYAIIDSGADHCVFPRSFMQPLGLDALTAPIEPSTGFSPKPPLCQPAWPEFSSFHTQPLSFHILIDSASVNHFGTHTCRVRSHKAF